MKVWVDISAPAHVLVFRPLIALLRGRGDEVEVTTRDYAQTLELLDRHGIEAEVLGSARRPLAGGQSVRTGLEAAKLSSGTRRDAATTSPSRTARTS